MDTFYDIQQAINYIEDNLNEKLEYETFAEKAFMSSFHFQRMFSVFCGCTLGEYIRNRKLTLAFIDVVNTENKILDIALRYWYDTPDGFTRASFSVSRILSSVSMTTSLVSG